jgi:hypothetical protein|tara:strand:- start:266 stop:685 length:420 start_codon:yes stop_codon:yes gene_type:complete
MDILDLSGTIKAKSDQLNADDLVAGPMMVQVEGVVLGKDPQQPVSIYYYGCENKPFKPCLTVRRMLIALWGMDGNQWANRWMNLYIDASVSFGKQKNIGGIRVDAVSHISSAATISLTVRRGMKQHFVIQPINLENNQT